MSLSLLPSTALTQGVLTGSSTVISYLNLMVNHRAETICACLHFSTYMMAAWCLHGHVATLRERFSAGARKCNAFFFTFHFTALKALRLTSQYRDPDLCILKMSCLQRCSNGRMPSKSKYSNSIPTGFLYSCCQVYLTLNIICQS